MLWNALLLSIREIRRNLLRSFLTTLGIVIGVAAVITMVTLGNGATRAVKDQIASLGSNLLIVRPGQRLGAGYGSVSAANFKVEDAAAIRAQIGGLKAVAPVVSKGVTVIAQANNWPTSITGTTADYFISNNWRLGQGRIFNESEERAGKAVCVIGNTLKRELFGAANPVGGEIRIKQFACEVIGLLASKGQSSMGSDQDDTVIMPLRTVQRRLTGNQDVRTLMVSVKDGVSTDKVQRQIKQLMRERRRIGDNEDDNFNVMDTKQIAETLSATTQVMTTLLGAVAAVSLLVGGIGIMNIMLVSVTERTREIGIRLAIGALEREVLSQFLIEAVVLSSLGGLIGVILATLASIGLSGLMNIPYLFNPSVNLLSFAFSAAIGVIFGYFPARRAASLDPIEALRHE
ncbi:MAG: multidrug ABC transporter substrate-binding protein [Hydrogenophilales bacterium CG_4_9_14_3_um_filter_63_34]|nr:MAG: multidrug ABC transporter substrate-binding protein [Hydrogenophilales bacterium CG_4_10_14_3_um_filter_63_21]PJB05361.1 MAG: multidrug ABC transporter substrate-binding protein [Hydrogenophilales bacterium CG_4_9_14_3_um_filter_63_34]